MGSLVAWAEAVGLSVFVIGLCGFIIWFEREPHPLMAEVIRRATEEIPDE